MAQSHIFGPSQPPAIGKRRCPKCDVPMFLSRVEPAAKYGCEERTFECSACAYAETATTPFG